MGRLATVRALLGHVSAGDPDDAAALVTDDVVMECTALGRQRGREVLRGTVAGHLTGLDSVTFRVHRESEVDGAVLNERTDRFVQGDQSVEIEAAGVFEFAPDGRISRWKDYFDPVDVDVLPRVMSPNFAKWETMPDVLAALELVDPSDRGNVGLARRRAAFEALVAQVRPDLDDRRSKGIGAVMREMTSAERWYVLTHRHRVKTGVAAAVTAWTTRLQLEALRAGDLPALWFPDDDPAAPPPAERSPTRSAATEAD